MAKRIASLFFSLLAFLPATLLAQVADNQKKYTAFEMRSNGKIYVVVAVVLIILIGLLLYLIRLDGKITRLEKH